MNEFALHGRPSVLPTLIAVDSDVAGRRKSDTTYGLPHTLAGRSGRIFICCASVNQSDFTSRSSSPARLTGEKRHRADPQAQYWASILVPAASLSA
jgi:hypothetical protein